MATIFEVQCGACKTVSDLWTSFDEIKNGDQCPICPGQRHIKICAAAVPQVPGDGVWRMEVRSKEVGEIASTGRGSDLKVVNDGAPRVF